ncbi:hypothetical protein BGZ76_009600 [Entomortierella beljakovae]|nr:hypothetical protein BGZ76_009600 [Entomortierella beljakovae]
MAQQQQQSPLQGVLKSSVTTNLIRSPSEPTHLDLKPYISRQRQHENIVAFTLQEILTPQECQSLIDRSESIGYDIALVNSSSGAGVHYPGYRDGHRCIIDDPTVAAELWTRIKHHVPAIYKNRPVIGMNERLRFLKYGPGDQFRAHMDGEYRRTDGSGHVTKITVQFYLNQDCQGGATSFLEERMAASDDDDAARKLAVNPKTGQVLVFQHDLVHEGSKVTQGMKYVIRSDILYGPHI